MNIETFLLQTTINLIKSGGFFIDTMLHSIKIGVLYETINKTIVVINVNQDGLIVCKQFNSDFEEIQRNTFESENDFIVFIDSLNLKESILNKRLVEILNRFSSFVKENKYQVIN